MTNKYEFEVVEPKHESVGRKITRQFVKPCSSWSRFAGSVGSFFPPLAWLPAYNVREQLLPDIIGGFTVGVLHVPQGIAYAILSGVKPVHGLYMSFFAPLFYMLFGTSRHTSIGSFAVVALMTGVANDNIMFAHHGANASAIAALEDYSAIPVNPVVVTATLACTVGVLQLLVAVLKLDFLCVYFSDPLVGGFTTGAAVHVFTSQIDDLMGVQLPRVSGVGYLFRVCLKLASLIPRANLVTLGTSLVAGAFLVIGKDYVTPALRRYSKLNITLPYELLVMIVATAVSYCFDWRNTHDVFVVGHVPRGLPEPHMPTLAIVPDCLPTALAITVVTLAIQISMAKMIAKRFEYQINPGQEIYALGFTSVLSSLFPVFPCSTALGRTMVLVEAGVRSQLASLFTCALLLAVILWLGPLFECLPLCILSTVIVVALRPMFRKCSEVLRLWRLSRLDCAIWVVAFVATVCIDVIGGLAVALAFALGTVVLRTQWPAWTALVSKPASDGDRFRRICVLRFDAPLLFTNTECFKRAALEVLARWTDHLPALSPSDKQGFWFVLDCSATTQLDAMGVGALQDVLGEVKVRTDAVVVFTSCQQQVAQSLVATGIAQDSSFYDSVDAFLEKSGLWFDAQPRPQFYEAVVDEEAKTRTHVL